MKKACSAEGPAVQKGLRADGYILCSAEVFAMFIQIVQLCIQPGEDMKIFK